MINPRRGGADALARHRTRGILSYWVVPVNEASSVNPARGSTLTVMPLDLVIVQSGDYF